MRTQKILIVALCALSVLAGCKEQETENKVIYPKVKIEKVNVASPEITKTYSGIIKEADEINLAFMVGGPIEKILIKEGDYVKKGQLLAQVDSRGYEIQHNAIKAQYEQLKSELKRLTELHNRKTLADNDYEKAVSGEKMLAEQLKHTTDQLNDTKLYAPYSGYIQKVNYSEGELIDVGMPFANIIDVSYYEVTVDVPITMYLMRDKFTLFSCSQNNISSKKIPLQLIGFNKKANNNQLYKLYFRLNPNDEQQLAVGMNVQVDITYLNRIENPISVPVHAIFRSEGKSFVWVYEASSGSVNKQSIVSDGLTSEGQIRIVSGLVGNEMIVVAGVNKLVDKLKVDVIQAASETNIGGLL